MTNCGRFCQAEGFFRRPGGFDVSLAGFRRDSVRQWAFSAGLAGFGRDSVRQRAFSAGLAGFGRDSVRQGAFSASLRARGCWSETGLLRKEAFSCHPLLSVTPPGTPEAPVTSRTRNTDTPWHARGPGTSVVALPPNLSALVSLNVFYTYLYQNL